MRDLERGLRGDDARGRNLQSLYFLERALRHGWFTYRPSRQPGRWLMVVLGLVGAQAGVPPEGRLRLSGRAVREMLKRVGLPRLALLTLDVLSEALSHTRALRQADCSAGVVRGLVERMSVAALLGHLGYDEDQNGPGRNLETSTVAQQLRRLVVRHLDPLWAAALEAVTTPGLAEVLGGLPPGFSGIERAVRRAFEHAGEHLPDGNFALFYSLVTDAALGTGRTWIPDERYVHGAAFTRADFEALRRGAVPAARLGLSGACPASVACIDGWLEQRVLPELECDADWYAHRLAASTRIASFERELLGHVNNAVARHDTRTGVDA